MSYVQLKPTTQADLEFVLSAERHPDNAGYIGHWSRARHAESILSEDEAHYIVMADAEPVGYLILTGLLNADLSMNVRRIVITQKRCGYGRQVLQQAKAIAFEQYGCHRLWLDVVLSNPHAQLLYESEGFVREGTIRDGYKTATGYESMALLSMLESEYFD